MHFGNSAGNFGSSAVRRPVGNDLAAAMLKLVALLPNYTQIVQNWSKKGVYTPKMNALCRLGCTVTNFVRCVKQQMLYAVGTAEIGALLYRY